MSQKKYDLEDRLMEISVEVIRLVEGLPNTKAGNHLGGQLLRSGTSPYLNHGEAQAAESNKDFMHKLRICLKELRESFRALKLIRAVPLSPELETLNAMINEFDELIRIFVASIRTASKRGVNEPPPEWGLSDDS